MKDSHKQQKQQDTERNAHTPSKARKDKPLSFLEREDNDNRGRQESDRFVEERRKQWNQGLS